MLKLLLYTTLTNTVKFGHDLAFIFVRGMITITTSLSNPSDSVCSTALPVFVNASRLTLFYVKLAFRTTRNINSDAMTTDQFLRITQYNM